MARRKKKSEGSIIIGPILVVASIIVLWKNETRFDYFRAAERTGEVVSPGACTEGDLFSFTGPMDPRLQIAGEYVTGFEGFLVVERTAEIYCWHRDEDDDGDVTWDMRWMGSVESNSRNRGIQQRLSDNWLLPEMFDIGELQVHPGLTEFVDPFRSIAPNGLVRSDNSLAQQMSGNGGYLYLSSGRGDRLGDERVSYSGVPVPRQATYFGRFGSDGRGVPYDEERRTGFISRMIKDSGILHHIVAGDRTTALASLKNHIFKLKWIVRAAGTAGIVFGLYLTLLILFRFLVRMPYVGWLVQKGTFLVALVVGIPLAAIVIGASFLYAHSLILLAVVLSIAAALYLIRMRGQRTQLEIRNQLDADFGRTVQDDELKELEYFELASLAAADGNFGDQEVAFLNNWGRRHGWDAGKRDEMLASARDMKTTRETEKASDEHLYQLIRLALADGYLSAYELHSIHTAATKAGFDAATVNELMNRVEQNARNAAVQSQGA